MELALAAAAVALLFIYFGPRWRDLTRVPPRQPERPACDYETFIATRRFKGLDGLRAISVVAVVWAHVAGSHTLQLLNQGHTGVDLFFAISGFLVTTLLLRELRSNGTVSLRNFYIRRSLRIFPLYYLVLAIYTVLSFLTLRGTPKGAEFFSNLPAFATYTSNWFVSLGKGGEGVTFYFAWSLATEEQFYLFWPPLLLGTLALTQRRWLPALVAMLLLAMQIIATASGAANLLKTVIASLAPSILTGAALAVALDQRSIFDRVAPLLSQWWSAPGVALLLGVLLQMGVPVLATQIVMALLVVCVCVRADTWLHQILNLRPLVFIGTISYGIYLLHMLAAHVARKVLKHQEGVDVFLLTLLVALTLAYLSYRYFESPLLRLKDRFSAESGSIPLRQPAPGVAAAT